MKNLAIAIFLLVAGCMPEKPVPIAYQCPKISVPPPPKSRTKTLSSKSTWPDIAHAYAADLIDYKGYSEIIYQQIDDYNNK